jgi:CRISPR/Cas system-associated exonuclease Cas4 (RecB family)
MDMCPRAQILEQLVPKTDEPDESDIDTRTQIIFDVGTALHEWWQEQYFGPMQVLKGKWRCPACGYVTSKMQTMPTHPHYCHEGTEDADGTPHEAASDPIAFGHNRSWKFDEVPVKSEEWGIVGHSDGIYILGKGTLAEEDVVLDIKTAGPSFWAGGARPYPSNIFQLNIYMWLLGKTKGVLLYVDKGACSTNDVGCAEVIVDYNDTHRKDACAKIDLYRKAVEKKRLPGRLATCEFRPNGAKAKKCPYRKQCLSDKNAAILEKQWGDVEYL